MSHISKNVINAITFNLMELEDTDAKLSFLTELFIYTEDLRYELSVGSDQELEDGTGDSLEVGQEQQETRDLLHEDAGDANVRGPFDYQTGLPL